MRDSGSCWAKRVQPCGQIIEGTEAGPFVFVDPTLGDLFEGRRIQIMKLLAATPERDNQIGPDQQIEMFTDSLAGHIQMATKFV